MFTDKKAKPRLAGRLVAWVLQYKLALAATTLASTSAILLTKCQQHDQPAWITAAVTMRLPADGTGLAVAWSADGKFLAATSRWGGTISVWDKKWDRTAYIRSDSGLGPFLHNTLSFLASDDLIVTEIPQLNTSTKSPIGELEREHLNVWSLSGEHVLFSGGFKQSGLSTFAVSPDRKLIVAAPTSEKFIRVLSLPDLKQVIDIPTASFSTSLAFLADGHRIAVGEFDGACTVLNLAGQTDQVSLVHFHEPFSASIQGQARGEVLADVGFVAVNPRNGSLAIGPGSGLVSFDPRKLSANVAKSPEESEKSSEDKVNRIIVLDPTLKMAVATYPDHISGVLRQMAWDPTGSFIAFVDQEELVFWSPFQKSLSPIVVRLNNTAMSLAFSPTDGLLAVTSASGVDIYKFSVDDNVRQ